MKNQNTKQQGELIDWKLALALGSLIILIGYLVFFFSDSANNTLCFLILGNLEGGK